MTTPLFSFVVPFYGSPRLLERCLDSLVAQTDGDFEAVVVDDCSPESGETVAVRYDERVRYVRQPKNGGPYQARLRGIGEARGAYVVCVDFDDYVLPALLAELRRAVEASAPDVVVYNLEKDFGGRIEPHWCRYEPGRYAPGEVLAALAGKRLQWTYFAKAVRRELVLEIWREMPAVRTAAVWTVEDFCAVVPILMKSRLTVVIPYVGYRYCEVPTSISRAVTWRKVRQTLRETRAAERLILSYAELLHMDAAAKSDVRATARMIRSWWLGELFASFKKRVKRVFGME